MAPRERGERLIGALRIVVAVTTLVIFVIDPSEDPGRRPFAQAVLAAFVAYSVVAYVLTLRGRRRIAPRLVPWVDAAWVTVLVGVSQGTSSAFYPLYIFAILCASFWHGWRRGIEVTAACVLAFGVVGAFTAPPPASHHLLPFLIRPLYLLVLGYLLSVWGGYEASSRARLALLRDVTALSNPRLGVDRTLGHVLEALRQFFDAESCTLAVAEQATGRRWSRSAYRASSDLTPELALPPHLADILLGYGADTGLLVRQRRLRAGADRVRFDVIAGGGGTRSRGDPARARMLLVTLDARSVLSAPFRQRGYGEGRIHVAHREPRAFDIGDLEFLRHVLELVAPALESIRLVDRLASDAAEEERRRIARDLHDSVVQPYLGLRLGLSAAGTALAEGRVDAARAQVLRLVELADGEIQTLRGYVRALRFGDSAEGGGLLDAAVRRFCGRFATATGIQVGVRTVGAPVHGDRLVGEVFQMVAEALSNVRRHTSAGRADVEIEFGAERLRLTVTNDGAGPARDFHPRSLAERAAALGGTLAVRAGAGTTSVCVEVPL